MRLVKALLYVWLAAASVHTYMAIVCAIARWLGRVTLEQETYVGMARVGLNEDDLEVLLRSIGR